jgi:hypothetical protein
MAQVEEMVVEFHLIIRSIEKLLKNAMVLIPLTISLKRYLALLMKLVR